MDNTQIGKRFRELLSGKNTNRPLVWLWGATPSFAVQNAGYPVSAAYNDPKMSFDAQIETIAQFGEDGIPRMAVGGASDVTWAFVWNCWRPCTAACWDWNRGSENAYIPQPKVTCAIRKP